MQSQGKWERFKEHEEKVCKDNQAHNICAKSGRPSKPLIANTH